MFNQFTSSSDVLLHMCTYLPQFSVMASLIAKDQSLVMILLKSAASTQAILGHTLISDSVLIGEAFSLNG